MKITSAFFILLPSMACAWDFEYSYNNLNEQIAYEYQDSTSDVSKTTIGNYVFYRPTSNGNQGEVTYKFEFDEVIERARLVAQIDTFKNLSSNPSGKGSIWACSEELLWVKLLDAPLNDFGSRTFKFDDLLPSQLLNTKTIYIQARIEAPTFQTNARFSYGHVNAIDPIFIFQADTFAPVPEPSSVLLVGIMVVIGMVRFR